MPTEWRGGSSPKSPITFVASDDVIAARECLNPNAAVIRVDALSRETKALGAVAFRRTGDAVTGSFRDAETIRKFGDVPVDLSTSSRLLSCSRVAKFVVLAL
jgi:hypothetical protein